jgi:hypothetical protein
MYINNNILVILYINIITKTIIITSPKFSPKNPIKNASLQNNTKHNITIIYVPKILHLLKCNM